VPAQVSIATTTLDIDQVVVAWTEPDYHHEEIL